MTDQQESFAPRPDVFGNEGEPEFTEDGKQNVEWCRICGGKSDPSETGFGQTIGHKRCREYVAQRVKDCAEVVERQTEERIALWLRTLSGDRGGTVTMSVGRSLSDRIEKGQHRVR